MRKRISAFVITRTSGIWISIAALLIIARHIDEAALCIK
jgi:hypothetical protein